MGRAAGRLPSGRWVRIHRVELVPSDRSDGLPPDTASVPFETWINGWLVEEADLGDRATIRTATGRVVEGELVQADPGYDHSFGTAPPALQRPGEQARGRLFGDEE
jgi:2-amino-4-ketopentanoate thiolase alpha subunit